MIYKGFFFYVYFQVIKVFKQFFLKEKKVDFDPNFKIGELFKKIEIPSNSRVFLYVGLKKLHKLTKLPYPQLTDQIIDNLMEKHKLHTILVPTNTFSFRKSGVFSVKYSKSEVGAFSELFRKKANFRTIDPIHNFCLLTKDINYFRNLNYEDTFSEVGLFGVAKNEYYYALNIDTDYLKIHQIHYMEVSKKSPYIDLNNNVYEGIVYDQYDQPKKLKQKNIKHKNYIKLNFNKMTKLLRHRGVLKQYDYRGIKIQLIKILDYHQVLEEKLQSDPYYFVTF